MSEEGFLRRWARVKASGDAAVAEAPPAPPAPIAPAPAPAPAVAPAATGSGAAAQADPQRPAPTLADAAGLTHESDFSAFVSPGVDQDVRRLALKKLFADPRFNVPDRLDMYMDDYNKPDPISAAMLAGLQHARSALRRPEEVQAELARLAALDPPPHPRGVAQPMPVAVVEAQEAQAPLAELADADAESGLAGDAPAADADQPEAHASDDPTHAPQHPAAAPLAIDQRDDTDKDAIALTIVHAHNLENRP